MSITTKLVCSRCGEEKDTRYFYLNKSSSTGYRSECKSCSKIDHNKRKVNPDYVKQRKFYQKVKRTRNPRNFEKYDRQRRARKAGVISESYTLDSILARYGTACHICGEQIDFSAPRQVGKIGWEQGLHLDHLIPISRGGPDTLDNIRPAHGLCNIKKGGMSSE